jgi:hypothetical protein
MKAKLRVIFFTNAAGQRKAVRLGRVTAAVEAAAREHLGYVRMAADNGRPLPPGTIDWLAAIGDRLHRRLARAGLVAPREAGTDLCKLKPFCDSYAKRRTDLKGRTRTNIDQAAGKLTGFFGADRDLRTITRGEAKDWHRHLRKTLAAATVATHTKKARQIFDDAADRRLIRDNPFKSVKAGRQDNPDRQQYVPAASIVQVCGACPDLEWQLIFRLARFGGLRIPSELLPLKWAHVDWQLHRMLIHSPKTEHCGKASRWVPISPMLFPCLRDAFEAAPEGSVHVIRLHRGENLRTTAQKIIRRAGLAQWPRLFQNLRASMETDWTTDHPLHVACQWAGNSAVVAKRHYLMVKEEEFAKASGVAQGAAPRGETRLTDCELAGAANPAITGESAVVVPPRVSEPGIISSGFLPLSRKTVRNALRRVTAAALVNLKHAVEASPAGGAA